MTLDELLKALQNIRDLNPSLADRPILIDMDGLESLVEVHKVYFYKGVYPYTAIGHIGKDYTFEDIEEIPAFQKYMEKHEPGGVA